MHKSKSGIMFQFSQNNRHLKISLKNEGLYLHALLRSSENVMASDFFDYGIHPIYCLDQNLSGFIPFEELERVEPGGYIRVTIHKNINQQQYIMSQPLIGRQSQPKVMCNWDYFVNRETVQFEQFFQSITCSYDGKFIACAFSNVIKIFNTQTGDLSFEFTPTDKSIKSIQYSTDDRYIITFDKQRTLSAWDSGTGEQISGPFTVFGYTLDYFDLNGQFLALLINKLTIRIINLINQSYFDYHNTIQKTISLIQYSSNGRFIIILDYLSDVHACVLNTQNSKYCILSLENIFRAKFSPNSSIIAYSITEGGGIFLQDSKSRKQICRFRGDSQAFFQIDFSPNGEYIVAASWWTREVYLWDIQERKTQVIPTLAQINSIQFSADGRFMLIGTTNKTMSIVRIEKKRIN